MLVIALSTIFSLCLFSLVWWNRKIRKKLQASLVQRDKQIESLHAKIQEIESALAQKSNTSQVVSKVKETVVLSGEILEQISQKLDDLNQDVNVNSQSVSNFANFVDEVSNSVEHLIQPLESLASNSQQLAHIEKEMNDLNTIIDSVSKSSSTISTLASQAKLLSFNASVEAARAGEAGKGFSVVATEVGKLAQLSGESSQNINRSISSASSFTESVNIEMKNHVETIQQVIGNANDLIENAKVSIHSLQEVHAHLNHLSSNIQSKLKSFSELNHSGLESLTKNLSDCIAKILGIEIKDLEVEEVANHLDDFIIIDVRHEHEYFGELGHIANAKLMTLQNNLEGQLQNLDKDQKYLFVCRSGGRSSKAAQIALNNQFKQVYNMAGGMLKWNELNLQVSKSA